SPGVQRLYFGFGFQSAKKPCFFSSVVPKDAPIDFSGTATITFFMPWFFNLSKAMNIKALDLPDAGGAFSNKYCAVLPSYAFSCISRIPKALVLLLFPVWSYVTCTKFGILFFFFHYFKN